MSIFLELFISFFKVGAFAFGGGMAMLPIIFQEVERYGMMTQTEFARLVALSQVTPGPVAVKAATYTGMIYAGVPGAVVATFGVALPSFAVIIIVMKFMEAFKESKGLEGILSGIRPATVGLIAAAFIYIAQTSIVSGKIFSLAFLKGFPHNIDIFSLCVFIATIVLAGKFKVGPVKIILLSGVAGALICGLAA
jgi:chromate transporter